MELTNKRMIQKLFGPTSLLEFVGCGMGAVATTYAVQVCGSRFLHTLRWYITHKKCGPCPARIPLTLNLLDVQC